jgi:hypothetical protein
MYIKLKNIFIQLPFGGVTRRCEENRLRSEQKEASSAYKAIAWRNQDENLQMSCIVACNWKPHYRPSLGECYQFKSGRFYIHTAERLFFHSAPAADGVAAKVFME